MNRSGNQCTIFKVVELGGLMFTDDDMTDSMVQQMAQLPEHSRLINMDDAPCPLVSTTNSAFFDVSN